VQTNLKPPFRDSAPGRTADAILRNCVHCGFCNATCPTYQVLGDELDGPRGRIYLIKSMLEGHRAGPATGEHLDRCLTCRACETTCPSGVQFGELIEIGRRIQAQNIPRTLHQGLERDLIRWILPYPRRLRPVLGIARALRSLLPARLRNTLPQIVSERGAPAPQVATGRTMLIVDGCVQSVTNPGINAASTRVLARLGIGVTRSKAGCCGAIAHHLASEEQARATMRSNIDTWLSVIDQGAEAIVVTASACSLMIKDYARLLADDPKYAERAARVSALCRDISEIVSSEDLSRLERTQPGKKIGFHVPCTLQHGQSLRGAVEKILLAQGHTLAETREPHLCCGAAGTYALQQYELSQQLRRRKLAALQVKSPDHIVTANIGCLLHLRKGTDVPVQHWIEVVDACSS